MGADFYNKKAPSASRGRSVINHIKTLILGRPVFFDRLSAETHLLSLDSVNIIYNMIYNVNIPINPKEIRITRQGGPYFGDNFVLQENNHYLPVGKSIFTEQGQIDFDTETVLIQRHISITPLTTNRTNMEVFQELSSLNH